MSEPSENAPRQSPAERHIEQLVRANQESNDTMRRLVDNVRHDAEMREKKINLLEAGIQQTHRIIWMVGVVFLLLIGLAIVNAVNLTRARQQASVTARTARDANRTYALLLDCLNDRGECGSRSAAANKAVIDDVKRHQLAVIYCARIHPQAADPDAQQFLKCVAQIYPGGPTLGK
jgi:hypothetical protein